MTAPASPTVSYHVAMDTTVAIEVSSNAPVDVHQRVRSAFRWFDEVERVCSRFDPASELSRLSAQPGTPVVVSELLFKLLQFAVQVAEASDGAFDPTVGASMVRSGFDRNFRTGEQVRPSGRLDGTFRDIVLEPTTRTVTLLKPLTLDLGGIAKGLAIDLAARELSSLSNFAVNAGGDIYAGGTNTDGAPWGIGVRDPRDFDTLAATFHLSDSAICTSGDYERRGGNADHHILDPRTGESAPGAASATVIAPTAMVADAFATAAFVLGPQRGIAFLEEQAVEGLIITTAGKRYETPGLARFEQ